MQYITYYIEIKTSPFCKAFILQENAKFKTVKFIFLEHEEGSLWITTFQKIF